MLQSPGNSPRHISSPSSSTPTPSTTLKSFSSTSQSPLTTISSRKTAKVLDEDTYVAAIEKIIERDYFPDIPKLRDRLDWLQALKSGDPVVIRDAQLKILERRCGSNTVRGKIATPGSTLLRNSITPFEFDRTPSLSNTRDDSGGIDVNGGDNSGGIDAEVSLDAFLRRYTSEDNDSFNKIIDRVNRKRKERYGYLLEGEKSEENGEVKGIEDVKRDRITDGFGTSNQPVSTLDGWKYRAKNLLMYHPADNGEVALTEDERAARLKGLTKEVDRYNTRFHGKMLMESERRDDEEEVLYTTVAGATPVMAERERDKTRKYDLEDLRKTPNSNTSKFYVESEKKAENGYSFVRTPSPAPGVDESPFITWGEIEGTPLRLDLDLEDTPLDIGGSGDGPRFNIPCPPSRDVKAHTLSREAARKIKDRTRMFQKPPLRPSSSLRSGSASPSARTLSPAAQKFMRNAMAKSSGTVDESLRASYRGNSPALGTPKSGRSISRLATDAGTRSPSPAVRDGSNPPW